MEQSILTGTKKILGLAEEYTAFDHDVLTHINSAFSTLGQVITGIPADFIVEDASPTWSDLGLERRKLNMVRTYIYLKVRVMFDPPTVSYLIDAMNEQIKEHESRLTYYEEAEAL